MNFTQTPVALVTFILIIGIGLYSLLKNNRIIEKFAFRPYYFIRGDYKTILTSTFVHADFPHLIFNTLTFYFFAFNVEAMIGSLNFLVIFYLSAIVADIPDLIKYKNYPNFASLGASAGISGVLFSFIMLNPTAKLSIIIIPFLLMPAFVFGILFLIFEKYSTKRNDGINHNAHIWGALAGILLTIYLIDNVIINLVNKISELF